MRTVSDPGWHMRPPARPYAEELQREIQRLRAQVAIQEQEIESLREERKESEARLRADRGLHRRLEAESSFLSRQLDDVIEKNRLLSDRCARAEERCSELAHRIAASTSLVEASDRSATVEAICGVLANLIGCEDLVIFTCDERGEDLVPLHSQGRPPHRSALLDAEYQEMLRDALRQRRVCIRRGSSSSEDSETSPIATIPLLAGERLVGLVALYRLLPHRVQRMEERDLDILRLVSVLGGQAYHLTQPESFEAMG